MLWTEAKRFAVVPAGRRSGKTEVAKRRLVAGLPVKKPQNSPRTLQNKRAKLEQNIQAAKAVANNLESFKRKREELEDQLKAALEKLPESSDLPALLTNITGLGKKSGLEIQTFKQGKKIDRGFPSEQQIELEFSGAYHDIGLFSTAWKPGFRRRSPGTAPSAPASAGARPRLRSCRAACCSGAGLPARATGCWAICRGSASRSTAPAGP